MDSEDDALQRLVELGEALLAPGPTPFGPHPDQVVEEYGPADARTLVLVHGGYFRPAVDRTHARPMARALAESGWRVVLAEYRRIPGRPTATTDDLTELDGWLRRDGHDVAAWVGHSAGGALVLWRALTRHLPPARAIALAPVADFDAAIAEHLGSAAVADWLGPDPTTRADLLAELDPTRLLAGASPADHITVLHGDADASVPLRQSGGWARTVLPGAHHFNLIDPASPHWPTVLDVIADAAGPPRG